MTTSRSIDTFDGSLTITGLNQIQPQPLTASSYPWTVTGLNVYDTNTYQGEMVVAEITITDTDAIITGMSAAGFREEMKRRLIYQLVENLMKNKLIEFTSQEFAHSQETKFRARIYALPDNQVRMIRKNMP